MSLDTLAPTGVYADGAILRNMEHFEKFGWRIRSVDDNMHATRPPSNGTLEIGACSQPALAQAHPSPSFILLVRHQIKPSPI